MVKKTTMEKSKPVQSCESRAESIYRNAGRDRSGKFTLSIRDTNKLSSSTPDDKQNIAGRAVICVSTNQKIPSQTAITSQLIKDKAIAGNDAKITEQATGRSEDNDNNIPRVTDEKRNSLNIIQNKDTIGNNSGTSQQVMKATNHNSGTSQQVMKAANHNSGTSQQVMKATDYNSATSRQMAKTANSNTGGNKREAEEVAENVNTNADQGTPGTPRISETPGQGSRRSSLRRGRVSELLKEKSVTFDGLRGSFGGLKSPGQLSRNPSWDLTETGRSTRKFSAQGAAGAFISDQINSMPQFYSAQTEFREAPASTASHLHFPIYVASSGSSEQSQKHYGGRLAHFSHGRSASIGALPSFHHHNNPSTLYLADGHHGSRPKTSRISTMSQPAVHKKVHSTVSVQSSKSHESSANLKVRIYSGLSEASFAPENPFDFFTANIRPVARPRGERGAESARREFERRRGKQQRLAATSSTESSLGWDANAEARALLAQDRHMAFSQARVPSLRRTPAVIKRPTPPKRLPFHSTSSLAPAGQTKSDLASFPVSETKAEAANAPPHVSKTPPGADTFQVLAWKDGTKSTTVRVDQHGHGDPRFYHWAPFDQLQVDKVRCFFTRDKPPPHLSPKPVGPLIPKAAILPEEADSEAIVGKARPKGRALLQTSAKTL